MSVSDGILISPLSVLPGALRLWLGAVLVAAGLLKLRSPDAYRRGLVVIIDRLRLPRRYEGHVAFVLVATEVVIGMVLMAGYLTTAVAASCALLLLVFTLLMITAESPDASGCGCFGALDAVRGSRWLFAVRNGILGAAAVVVAAVPDPRSAWRSHPDWPSLVSGAFLFFISASLYVLALLLVSPRDAYDSVGDHSQPTDI